MVASYDMEVVLRSPKSCFSKSVGYFSEVGCKLGQGRGRGNPRLMQTSHVHITHAATQSDDEMLLS